MKRILLFVFCFAVKYANATQLASALQHDTIIEQRNHQLTREQFLAGYGCDDSSRALINFYFHRRKSHQTGFFSGAGLAMIAAIASVPVSNMSDNVNGSSYAILTDKGVLIIAVSILASVSVPLITAGGSLWIRYSRTRLLKMLNKYFSGKSIPAGIARNIVFRAYLHYGEWGAGIKRQMKLADAHRKKILKKALRDAQWY